MVITRIIIIVIEITIVMDNYNSNNNTDSNNNTNNDNDNHHNMETQDNHHASQLIMRLGTCWTSLVSPEQSVLCIFIRSTNLTAFLLFLSGTN